MADVEKKVKVVIDGDARGVENAFQSTSRSAGVMQGNISGVAGSLSAFSAQMAIGVGSLIAMTSAIKEGVQAANQMERANIGLAVTARYVGADIQATTRAAKELAKDGLMSVTEASQGLQNLLSRGYTLEQSIQLLNRMKDAAAFNRQAHLEFGESIVGATEGLKNENSVLVDNAGVTKNVSMMWKEYAAEHGKSVDALTQAEKRQAEYVGIMRETEGQVGNAARMSDTYSGAQARINQQWFEAKAAFGSSLQPVLKATLDLMLPIVKGLRDMVFWVETLGPRAGAVYDKMKIRLEETFNFTPGVGMGVRDKNARIAARTAEVDSVLEESIGDIVKRYDGESLPNIGADPGKRRKDVVIPPKKKEGRPSWATSPTGRGFFNAAWDNAASELAFEQSSGTSLSGGTLGSGLKYGSPSYSLWGASGQATAAANADGQMTPAQQAAFDAASWSAAWEVARQSDLERETEFNAMRAEMRGESTQMEMLRINDEQSMWEQAWAMQTDSFQVYEERMTQIAIVMEQRRSQVRRAELQQQLSWTASGFNSMATVMDSFYQLSGKKSKAAFKAYQAAKSGETIVSTGSAAMKAYDAMASIPYVGPILGAAAAAAAIAAGAVQLQNIWSASDDGGGTIGGIGDSGTYASNQVVTQPVRGQDQQTGPQVTIVVQGNLIGQDQWVEDHLAPTIRELVGRKVDFGMQPA